VILNVEETPFDGLPTAVPAEISRRSVPALCCPWCEGVV